MRRSSVVKSINKVFFPLMFNGLGTLVGVILFIVPLNFLPADLFIEIRFVLVASAFSATFFLFGIDQKLAYANDSEKSNYLSYIKFLWVAHVPICLFGIAIVNTELVILGVSLSLAVLTFLINVTRIDGSYLSYAITHQFGLKLIWCLGFIAAWTWGNSVAFGSVLMISYFLISINYNLLKIDQDWRFNYKKILTDRGFLSCFSPLIIIFLERFFYLICYISYSHGLMTEDVLVGIDFGTIAGSLVFLVGQVVSRYLESSTYNEGKGLPKNKLLIRDISVHYSLHGGIVRTIQFLVVSGFCTSVWFLSDFGLIDQMNFNGIVAGSTITAYGAVCLTGVPNLIVLKFESRQRFFIGMLIALVPLVFAIANNKDWLLVGVAWYVLFVSKVFWTSKRETLQSVTALDWIFMTGLLVVAVSFLTLVW